MKNRTFTVLCAAKRADASGGLMRGLWGWRSPAEVGRQFIESDVMSASNDGFVALSGRPEKGNERCVLTPVGRRALEAQQQRLRRGMV